MRLGFQAFFGSKQLLALLACVFLENKIGAHYNFGIFWKLQAHGLTAMLCAYQMLLADA